MSLTRRIKRLLKRNEEVAVKKRRKKALLEPLEPRMLLSADLKVVTTGAASDDDLPLQNAESAAGLVDMADQTLVQGQTQADLPPAASESSIPIAAQVFFLDFDGALDITYEGPVTIHDVDIPAFTAPDSLEAQKAEIIASVLSSLQEAFLDSGLVFTVDEPSGDYSTIYIGGAGEAFAEYGPFIGLSEKIDKGNLDRSDIAFVFTDQLMSSVKSAEDYASALAGFVAHEAGHLMGWEHVYEADAKNPLAAVGWKPYVHIEIAQDVRNDLLEDGKITIVGNDYDVHPRILEALKKYPAFYYAGAVGPDGFPELVMGQSVLHPESTGIWVGHVLDMAWKAQTDAKYSETEKLQILAWAYGFPTHVAGDVWCHTLTNEFTGGPWPDFGDILNPSEPKYLASVIKHLLIEGYIGDATPGFDGNEDRTQLPTGDVSDDATPARELGAVSEFIYDALIYNLPDLPGRQIELKFTIDSADPDLPGYLADLASETLTDGLKTMFQSNGNTLGLVTTVSEITAGSLWQIKSDYAYYDLRINGDGGLEISQIMKSRGIIADQIINLRETLINLVAGAPFNSPYSGPPPADYEPLAGLVDGILQAIDNLLKGEDLVDKDALLDDLKELGGKISDTFKDVFAKITSGDLSGLDLKGFVTDLASSLGEQAANYLHYWISNIDEGLKHWGDFGLASSRALFDPENRRDLQNETGESYGPDAVDPAFLDRRGDAESEVGLLDVLLNEIDDLNGDGKTDDSFINRYLLPMVGMPRKIGELRAGLQAGFEELEEKILEPARELLGDINPFDPILDWIKEEIKEYAKELLRNAVIEVFGFDIELFEFFSGSPSGKLDLASITLKAGSLPGLTSDLVVDLFKSTDHERLDQHLGFTGTDHHQDFTLGSYVQDYGAFAVEYYSDAMGGLFDNVEYDKDAFAVYANSRTLSKLLLLQETDPLSSSEPKTISKLLSDLLSNPGRESGDPGYLEPGDAGYQYYDFAQMELNGDHGGDILTATMPGVVNPYGQPVSVIDKYGQPIYGNIWLTTIDGDHTWRQDSATAFTSLFRFHRPSDGNTVTWTFGGLAAGDYKVYADWSTTLYIDPAKNAPYSIFDGTTLEATVLVDQSKAPADAEFTDLLNGRSRLDVWKELGTFQISSGTLKVSLGDNADGDVVAGRIRIVNTATGASQIISNLDSGYAERPEGVAGKIGSVAAGSLAMVLDSGAVPSEIQALLAADKNAREASLPADKKPEVVQWLARQVTAGSEWEITDLEKVKGITLGTQFFEKLRYGATYKVKLESGDLNLYVDWQGIAYPLGTGNSPLWESSVLRDSAFRVLFKDWENGTQIFPALGDTATSDSRLVASLTFGAFPAYTPYADD